MPPNKSPGSNRPNQAAKGRRLVADARKRNGLIVDCIGVSAHLDRALASYRADDVRNAMRDLDDLRNQLRAAHAAVLHMMKGVKRAGGRIDKDSLKAEFDQLVARLKPDETQWIEFRNKAREFIGLYEAVSPAPCVLEFTADLKWVALFLHVADLVRRHGEPNGLKPKDARVKDQKHVWGSCGIDRVVNLNWQLVFAPPDGAGIRGGP
ncbi:M48 metallopeptidase family protein [Azospirillum agricola]|uniref:M48 metallopeptidase family protein n=1 Tax=Azospirillum agricola TaxID=1720247 RepID=UPI000A0F165D|nr:M48 family metallopeptidase [Azospirillum agricola]SMH55152.1 Protein of unknown function DUF45 [Azospirillum lipoferum]